MSATRIFIVDDHPLVRRGLSNFINSRDDLSVCGDAEDANTAIAKINTCSPDIVIVDIALKEISGIELVKSILARHRAIRVLVLTMHDEIEYVERAIQAGASGYVLKSEREEQIIDAIRAIQSGKNYISDSLKDALVDKMLWNPRETQKEDADHLTEREREILVLIGQGLSTRQISDKLALGISTIGTYRDRIKKKLNIRGTGELMRYAMENLRENDRR